MRAPAPSTIRILTSIFRGEILPRMRAQTCQTHPDVRAAIKTLYRTLKPGGVLLVTVPGITQSSREDVARWGQYWSFTTQSILRLFREIFPPEQVQVKAYGNVLAATAFLYGVAAHELREQELDYRDPDYEVVITVRAVKPIPPC